MDQSEQMQLQQPVMGVVAGAGQMACSTTPYQMVVSFSKKDEQDVVYPHNDALVLTPIIGNYGVRRTLVDNSSAVNLLSLDAYKLMKCPRSELVSCQKSTIGVNGVPIPIAEVTFLPIFFREDSSRRTEQQLFIVVNLNLPYNVILGRPFLNAFGAVISQWHLKMKYPPGMASSQSKATKINSGMLCYHD